MSFDKTNNEVQILPKDVDVVMGTEGEMELPPMKPKLKKPCKEQLLLEEQAKTMFPFLQDGLDALQAFASVVVEYLLKSDTIYSCKGGTEYKIKSVYYPLIKRKFRSQLVLEVINCDTDEVARGSKESAARLQCISGVFAAMKMGSQTLKYWLPEDIRRFRKRACQSDDVVQFLTKYQNLVPVRERGMDGGWVVDDVMCCVITEECCGGCSQRLCRFQQKTSHQSEQERQAQIGGG